MAATPNKVRRGSAKPAAGQAGISAEELDDIDIENLDKAPRWLTLSSLLLSIVGLALSIYLTISHYTDQAALICQANSVVNCLKVTTSPESVIFGIPVAVLGLVFYVPMVVLNSSWGWRSTIAAVRWLRLAGVAVGLVFVVYLVAAELVIIGSICEWCTGVHVITLALFVVVVIGHYKMTANLALKRALEQIR